MELDKINLKGLNSEQRKYKIIRTILEENRGKKDMINEELFEKAKNENDKELLLSVFLGGVITGVSNIFNENRKDDYGVTECFYPQLLDSMKKLSEELKLGNSLELSNLYSYLLWNGYLSKTKQNVYSMENRKLIHGLFFTDIMDGVGVCLNHADMLKDFLCKSGYNASVMLNLADKKMQIDYRMEIKRNFKKIGLKGRILSFLVMPISKKMGIGNHAFTLIEDNGGLYIYDATNLLLLEITNCFSAKLINGTGTFKLFPYFSTAFNSGSIEISSIDKLFELTDFSSPYDGHDFSCTGYENIQLFKDNISLLEDFYDDARSNIVSIADATDKIKTKKKVK